MSIRRKKIIPALLSGAAFSPADLPNLFSWLKNNITQDGFGNITWINEVHPTSSGIYPLFAAGNGCTITTLNGKNVLDCPGNNFQSGNDVGGGIPSTVPIFEQSNSSFTMGGIIDSTGISNGAFHRQSGVSNSQISLQQLITGFVQLSIIDETGNAILVNSPNQLSVAGWTIIFLRFNWATKLAEFIHGGSINTDSLFGLGNVTFVYPDNLNGAYTLNTRETVNFPYTGGIGETFYYTDVKSDSDVNDLGNYLASEYNLSWTNI